MLQAVPEGESMRLHIPARAPAFRRAATMVGGAPELARRLNVSQHQLDYWMREIGTPPDTMFFDVLSIIIENAGERV